LANRIDDTQQQKKTRYTQIFSWLPDNNIVRENFAKFKSSTQHISIERSSTIIIWNFRKFNNLISRAIGYKRSAKSIYGLANVDDLVEILCGN
jgi:hypothetical protein